jgi:hypothetical protein
MPTELHPDNPLALGRKQHRIVTEAIERWLGIGLIDKDTAARLAGSIAVAPFDWQRTARYAFVVAISCIVIAVGALLADKALIALLKRVFAAPAIVKCAFFAVVCAAVFRYGLYLRARYPARIYSNEAVLFLGVLAAAAAIFFLGVALDTGTRHYSILFLVAAILYALLGLWFPSRLVWIFALFSLGSWMGAETGYLSGYGAYFLGMSYPLRFVLFGAVLAFVGMALERRDPAELDRASASTPMQRLEYLAAQTKVVGLLCVFIGLWIMSIFGNYGDMALWHRVRQYELFHWSVLFGIAAAAALWYGLKRDDGVLRGFGLVFLGINLYTRFFEYFWDSLHKAVFFALLAASLWYLGRKAETIWHLGEARRRAPA